MIMSVLKQNLRLTIMITVVLSGIMLPVACAPAGDKVGDVMFPATLSPSATESPITPAAEAPNSHGGSEQGLEPGEVPQELFDTVMANLLDRSGASIDDVVVVKNEAVVWSDGSLGCPQPDVMYTQALVNGYQLVFEVNGISYDYRLSEQGYFLLCNGAQVPGLPAGTPTE